MKLGIKREVEVDAKVLSVTAKVSDCFGATLYGADGGQLHEYDGYVPSFFPGGGGDYMSLDIDLETGRITNWTPPSAEQLRDWIGGEED